MNIEIITASGNTQIVIIDLSFKDNMFSDIYDTIIKRFIFARILLNILVFWQAYILR